MFGSTTNDFLICPRCGITEPVSAEVSVKEMIATVYRDVSSKMLMNFAVAVPDFSLLPAAKLNKSVVYALRNSKDHGINYEHTQGNEELRKQIARLSFNWGGKFSVDDIVVTAGCMEALILSLAHRYPSMGIRLQLNLRPILEYTRQLKA